MRQLLFSVFCLCIASHASAEISDISKIYHQTPTLEGLNVCFGGGCALIKHVSISEPEWSKVQTIFALNTDDPVIEREYIANAIGQMETIVVEKIGTAGDRAGTFKNSQFSGQLDCNDEAINSTSYMRLMQTNNLIKLQRRRYAYQKFLF